MSDDKKLFPQRPPLIASDIEYTCHYCMKTEPEHCDRADCPMRRFPAQFAAGERDNDKA